MTSGTNALGRLSIERTVTDDLRSLAPRISVDRTGLRVCAQHWAHEQRTLTCMLAETLRRLLLPLLAGSRTPVHEPHKRGPDDTQNETEDSTNQPDQSERR